MVNDVVMDGGGCLPGPFSCFFLLLIPSYVIFIMFFTVIFIYVSC